MAEPRRSGTQRFRRGDFGERVIAVLERGSRRDADLFLVDLGDARVVVKDFAPRGWLVRNTIGRLLTAREVRAYRALEGHPAVPQLVGQIDGFAFAIEYRPGRRVSRGAVSRAAPEFIRELEQAVREAHARGVVHLDLRHRGNALVGEDGRPVLIDFASSLCFRPGGFAARWLLPWLARLDLAALEKWRSGAERRSAAARQAEAEGASPGAASEAARGERRPT